MAHTIVLRPCMETMDTPYHKQLTHGYPTHVEAGRALEIGVGRVTYMGIIFTFTDPQSPYGHATIR